MFKSVVGGMVRTGLSALGGWLLSKGLTTAEGAAAIANGADVIVGVGSVVVAAAWSWYNKRAK